MKSIRFWLLDHGASWSARIGDAFGGPFYRLERRLAERWIKEKKNHV